MNTENLTYTYRLKEFRQKMGIRQEDLAEALGVMSKTVSAWETGRSLPRVIDAVRIAQFFDAMVEDMVTVRRASDGKA